MARPNASACLAVAVRLSVTLLIDDTAAARRILMAARMHAERRNERWST